MGVAAAPLPKLYPKGITMKHKFLVAAIATALFMPMGSALAQDQDAQKQDREVERARKEGKQLDKVVVTGSLIPQAQIETASPVITITAAQMQREG
ncbi:TonB-dependent outer membrane receptor, partial [mine drainage metagenome]